MLAKPKHLGRAYAAQFQDMSVVNAYRFRPQHPPETFAILAKLVAGSPRRVLDVGCGTGFLSRPLAPLVDHVDALDCSPAMIEAGKALDGGDHPHLRWIHGAAESAPLTPPYGLITAGDSLHWMEWEIVMPRFRKALLPDGHLALVTVSATPREPFDPVAPDIGCYSTNKDFRPYDLLDELKRRGMLDVCGQTRTSPVAFTQSLDDFVESYHARNGLSRNRMTTSVAAEFDNAVRAWILKTHRNGRIEFDVRSEITCGVPAPLDPVRY